MFVVVLICISLTTSDDEHLSGSSRPPVCFLWRHVHLELLVLDGLLLSLLLFF